MSHGHTVFFHCMGEALLCASLLQPDVAISPVNDRLGICMNLAESHLQAAGAPDTTCNIVCHAQAPDRLWHS